jgi:hypothetical protein
VEAFLVDQDLEYPNLDETNIIYTNYINFVCSKKSKKLYLFNNKNKFNDENDFSEVFFQNWYRDKESKEYFSNKISIVQILNRLTFFSLLNDIKNFNAIKFWANKFSKITIMTESESLKRVCNYFDNVELVTNFKCKIKNNEYIPSTPERKKYFFFKKSIKRDLVSIIDKFFNLNSKKNKFLAIIDKRVNSDFLKNKDILFLNDKRFLKGFYFHKSQNYNSFDKKILTYSNYHSSLSLFKKYFNKNESEFLNKIFFNLIVNEFSKNEKLIIKTINIVDKTLNFYKPKGIILNSANDWITSIFLQLSKKYRIKIFLLLDGYNFFKSNLNIPKNIDNKEYYNFYFAYGNSFLNTLLAHKINKNKIIKVKIPQFNIKKKIKKIIYDCCIVSYDPYIYNLNTTWDSKTITELKILNVLNKLGFNKICIKVKDSASFIKKNSFITINKIHELYYKIYKEKLRFDIYIETGELKYSILKSKILIGGISTSFVESNLLDTPYYIYEPTNNGINKSKIDRIHLIDKKYILRSDKELFSNLNKKIFCKINLSKENKGISIQNLDLNTF